jgi:hypothetical protein
MGKDKRGGISQQQHLVELARLHESQGSKQKIAESHVLFQNPGEMLVEIKLAAPENSRRRKIARDVLLALVPLGIAQGYSMSGFPPTIVGAVICWMLTAALLTHAAWIGTPRINPRVRIVGLVGIYAIVVWLLWAPVQTEYQREHSGVGSEALHVGITTTIFSVDYPPIWIEFREVKGKCVAPVNVLIGMVLTNGSQNPIQLRSATMQYKSGWMSWSNMPYLPPGQLYWTQESHDGFADLSQAIPINLDVKDVNSLSSNSLAPKTAYGAYAAFEYPV